MLFIFRYTLQIFRLGRRCELNECDLTKPLPEHQSSNLGNKVARIWSEEVDRARDNSELPSMTKVIFKCFYLDVVLYGIVLVTMEIGLRYL